MAARYTVHMYIAADLSLLAYLLIFKVAKKALIEKTHYNVTLSHNQHHVPRHYLSLECPKLAALLMSF